MRAISQSRQEIWTAIYRDTALLALTLTALSGKPYCIIEGHTLVIFFFCLDSINAGGRRCQRMSSYHINSEISNLYDPLQNDRASFSTPPATASQNIAKYGQTAYTSSHNVVFPMKIDPRVPEVGWTTMA